MSVSAAAWSPPRQARRRSSSDHIVRGVGQYANIRTYRARRLRFVTAFARLWQTRCSVSATTHATIAALACLSISCFGRPTYECSENPNCVVGDVMGVCEPEGVCSYYDEACA